MGWIRALKKRIAETPFMPEPPRRAEGQGFASDHRNPAASHGGIALFMVLAAVAVLSVLVTEFVYVSNINQKLAFDGLDQLRAHYLAKSGLKLGLLRLKAYQNVQNTIKTLTGGASGGGGAAPGVPKRALDMIWSFPFSYPVPTNIPGLTPTDKASIEKFQKSSGLDGAFSLNIESESTKYPINMILGGQFAQNLAGPSPTPSATPAQPPAGGTTPGQPQPTPTPSFDAQKAVQGLSDYLAQTLQSKFESDQDFAEEYRDFRMEDFMDNLQGWISWKYERHQDTGDLPMKKGPMYSLTELHMVPLMDDQLYNLFEPTLTASTTGGIDVDMMKEPTLRALVPGMTQDEVDAFFKYRDSMEEDNHFKTPDDFYKYLHDYVAIFHKDDGEIQKFKQNLNDRHIILVADSSLFKITVRAQANQSVRLLEAWVTMGPPGSSSSAGNPNPPKPQPGAPGAPPPLAGPGPGATQTTPDSGIKITFMRIL